MGVVTGPSTAMGIYHPIAQGKTARRCASLDRGARAWGAEVRYRGAAKRGAVLMTLTFDRLLPDEKAAAAIRRFWDVYDKHFARTPARRCGGKTKLGARCSAWAVVTTERCSAHGGIKPEGGDPERQRFQRLSWLEYQRSGRHHYHAIVLDPPPRMMGHDWTVVQRLWREGRTNLLWRNAEWVDRQAVAYAVSYTKKFGSKGYQQQYEQASKAIRTYQTNRLRSADARLERLPRWAYHAASSAGLRLVDGKRVPGGGLLVQGSGNAAGVPLPSVAYHLSVEHQINWWERAYWPPGTVVVRLGAVHWQPRSDLDNRIHSARRLASSKARTKANRPPCPIP